MTRDNGIFYQELRERSVQVRQLMENDENVEEMIVQAAHTLIWLSEQVRRKGLLWLGEASQSERVSTLVLAKELVKMMELVVDGTDHEVVYDICMKRYFKGMTSGDIQRVLADVPQDILAAAMQGWERELRGLVCGNLPRQTAEAVTRAMERTNESNLPGKEASEKLLAILQRLEDCGEITIRE